MPELDPLAALPGLVNGPVAPRAAFAEELRDRLLGELSADQPEPVMSTGGTTDLGVIPAMAAPPARIRPARRRRLPALLEIAAILVLVTGLIAALVPGRFGNEQPPPTIDAVQGVPPVAMASPALANESTTSQVHDDVLWQLPPRDDETYFTETVLSDGTLYRMVLSLSFVGVEAIDAVTGDQLWEQATPVGGQIAADENGVYVVANSFSIPEEYTGTPAAVSVLEATSVTVVALDPATGAERWRANTGDILASPIVRDGVLYVRDNPLMSLQAFDTTESIFAIDTSDGSIIWEQVIGNPHRGTALDPARDSMVVNETTLAIVSSNGTLAVLDVETGEIHWHMLGFQLRTTDLALAGNTLVVAGYFQTPLRIPSDLPELSTPAGIVGFDVEDGSVRWIINAGSSPPDLGMAGSELVAVMGVMPGTGATATTWEDVPDYTVSGIDPVAGTVTWVATGGYGVIPELYPAADGGTLVALLFRNQLIVQIVDAADGVLLLASTFTADMPLASAPLIASDTGVAYYPLADSSLIAVRLNPFPQAQTAQLATPEPASEPEPAEGWMIPATADLAASPDLVVDGGMVFRTIHAGLRDTSVQAIDLDTGTALWTQQIEWPRYTKPSDGYSAQTIAMGDGLVFVELTTVTEFTGESDDTRFTGDSMIAAFDQARGVPVWTKELGPQVGPLIYHNGSLIFGGMDTITSFDATTGEEQWRVSLGRDGQPILTPGSQLAIAADTLVAIASDGTITGIDLVSGKIRWSQAFADGTAWSDADPLSLGVIGIDASGDRVVILGAHAPASGGTPTATPGIVTTDTWVKALDETTGEVLWVADTAPAATSLVAGPDSVAIFSIDPQASTFEEIGGSPNTLTWIYLETGQPIRGAYSREYEAFGGATLSPDGSLLFIGTWSGDLLVVETSALSLATPRTFPVTRQPIITAPIVTDDYVLITTQDGTLRAVPLDTVTDV